MQLTNFPGPDRPKK